jgi:cell division protease FtsH
MALGLLACLVLLFGVFAWTLSYLYRPTSAGTRLSMGELQALTEQGRVKHAVLRDADNLIVGDFVAATDTARVRRWPPAAAMASFGTATPVANASSTGRFTVSVPSSGQAFTTVTAAFRTARTDYRVDAQRPKQVVKAVSTFLLPLMILANLFALLFSLGRSSGSAIGEVMTFGTIGKGGNKRARATVSFEDVGGADEAVAELREVRDYLANPAKYEALGAAPPKGVLLFGPPGTGKTLLAKAVAGEAGVPFFSVAGAEFVESLVGVGAARVRDLFARVRAAAPAIVFIDELDAAGRKRGAGGAGGGSDEREQTLNQLLVEMDGFDVSQGIVVMGATNRPDILDPALMRPGRFDRHITIERPEVEGRVHILRIHARGKPIGADVDLDLVARRTPGFTGADLANVVNEATLLAIRDGRSEIAQDDLEEAIQRVLNGPKRRGRLLSDEERQRTAYHESGHAIAAAATGRADDVHRVSILARGRAAATTQLDPEADAMLLSRSQLRSKLLLLLSGVAAEQLVFGEESTGGEQDIEQASRVARDIVARYGMSPGLGPIRLLAPTGAGYLGDSTPYAELADDTRTAIDAEMRQLLADARADALAVLSGHRAALDGLASKLLVMETLDGDVLHEILANVSDGDRAVKAHRSASRRSGGRSPVDA